MLSMQNARILHKIKLFLNIIEQRYKNETYENSAGSIRPTDADVEPAPVLTSEPAAVLSLGLYSELYTQQLEKGHK